LLSEFNFADVLLPIQFALRAPRMTMNTNIYFQWDNVSSLTNHSIVVRVFDNLNAFTN